MAQSILLFCLFIFLSQVISQQVKKHYECATFTSDNASPRIMIIGGADNIGSAVAIKLKEMNFTSVEIIGDSLSRQHNNHLYQTEGIQRTHDGPRDFCVANLSLEETSRVLFVNADMVIHLANLDARHQFEDRSALLHRFLHIDSNVLRAIHH